MGTPGISDYFDRFESLRDLLRSPLVWLSVVAAFLYSSWPWGFILDPSVGRHSLASELEAPHHPYNWLFIAMDVLTGVVLLGIGWWQLRKHSGEVPRILIWSYLSFGLLVAVAALTPLVCDPTAQNCGPLIHNYRILVHGIASVASVIFLLAALVGVAHQAHKKSSRRYTAAGFGALLLGWLFFGMGSVYGMLSHTSFGNSMQYFFITLCSFSLVAVVAYIEFHRLLAKRA